jgi:hypothetical protein
VHWVLAINVKLTLQRIFWPANFTAAHVATECPEMLDAPLIVVDAVAHRLSLSRHDEMALACSLPICVVQSDALLTIVTQSI